MILREGIEQNEKNMLSPKATLSICSKGRKTKEDPCPIRTCFQRDRDRIIHSKSFRRLKHKTQVFVAPEEDHYRTRLTHTLEVAQIGRTIARALRLNEDLVEAICLGHDLGHTPFGHTGEKILNALNPDGFAHYEQSIRVVDILEKRGTRRGLNLTFEVLDGILNHSGNRQASTLEGKVVKFADRIAYINHDIDDAIRAKVICKEDIPKSLLNILGETHSARINRMIMDVVENSMDQEEINMSFEVSQATNELRTFMFENVYYNPIAKSQDKKAEFVINTVFEYYLKNFEQLPEEHLSIYEDKELQDQKRIITDYIAGTTDTYIVSLFEKLFVPSPWRN